MAKSNNTTGSVRTKPILFSAPMVRALLEGRKTQTRRVIKEAARMIHQEKWEVREQNGKFGHYQIGAEQPNAILKPKALSGDLFYVKEAWSTCEFFDHMPPKEIAASCKTGASSIPHFPILYQANGARKNWVKGWVGRSRSALHMPRWASRLTLRVTDVRVERLHDISEADARAEGAHHQNGNHDEYGLCRELVVEAKDDYRHIWESLYPTSSPKAWHRNPWVWVYSFEVIKKNVDEVA